MAFSNLDEAIFEGTGKYDNEKFYFINNTTKDDIEIWWAAHEPEARGHGKYLIKAGDKGGPYPQFLAYHILKALVSREMQKDGKQKQFGTAEFRKAYEEKFLQEADGAVEDTYTAQIRAQERQKVMDELKNQPISEDGYTTSETRRKALKKKSHTDDEFAGANRE